MDPIRPLPVHVAPTTDRKTERGRFESALRGAAHGVAGAVVQSVSLAAPFLPGGPILAGAVRGAASPPPTAHGPTTGGHGASASGALPAPGGSLPASGSGGALGAVGGGVEGGGTDLVEATRALQAQAQSFNLQYLNLQESMQRESRQFSAVSNVMKVRHDTAKSAIQNIH